MKGDSSVREARRPAGVDCGGALVDEVAQLRVALESSRLISAAVGMLMERHSLSREDAFEVLSRASQASNVKIRVIAEQMICSHEAGLPRRVPGHTGPRRT